MSKVVCYAWKADQMKAHAYEYTHEECYEKKHGLIPKGLLLWEMRDGSCWVLDSSEFSKSSTCVSCYKPLREDTND